MTYEDSTTVTVANPAYTKEVKVPAVNELYTLQISTDATNDTIKSDGAATTMLTAKIIEKATGEAVLNDAQIQFSTTAGSLSQPQVALVNGGASTQLRSISSATSVTAIVNATVASAPGATQYVGLTGSKAVNFTPDGSGAGQVNMVSAVSAGSSQGDRFYVKFSGNIDAKAYKDIVTAAGWAGTPFGVQYIDGNNANHNLKIDDVYNLTPDTLMFVLDTDDELAANKSVNPGIGAANLEMIDASFTGTSGKGNFLRDNVNHKIVFPANITGLVVNSSPITFMMSDVTKPFIYGVDAKTESGVDSNMALTVRASEALSQALTETTAVNTINDNFTIDGKKVRLADPSWNSTQLTAAVNAAKAANEILVTDLYVGEYNENTTPAVDNRSKVYINIHKDFKLAAGTHGIQIANIGDLAGHTDSPANKVTTQTFPFTVAADTNAPAATVTAESPEQWLITFTRPVDNITGKDIEDAIKIYTKEGYNASTKSPLVQGNAATTNDYVITQVDENGVAIGGNIATGTQLSGVTRLLVEFNRDWSVKLQGGDTTNDNYWKSAVNPFKVVIGNVESTSGVAMPETTYDVAPQYDGVSPIIDDAQDLYAKTPDKAFRTITAAANNTAGKYVYVQMSEPVQLVDASGVQISNPTTPNLQQDVTPETAGEVQGTTTTGLPRSTYRFINDANPDKVVLGTVRDLSEDDKSFVIQPVTTLDAGTWTLYIEQISDDHGNTSATISKKVTVPETTATTTDTKVAWAAFDNNAGASVNDYDYLYVKFTKEMKAYTANGVDATTNYKFRGYDLPEGSQVFRGIDGVTDNWDGVTIRMPKGAWDGLTATDFTTNMTIASNFQAADGETLSGTQPTQFELTKSTGTSAADKDGLGASGTGKFEAVYYNADASTLVGNAATLQATATDSDSDGDIDTITLVSDKAISTVTGEYIYVNGKKFVVSGAGSAVFLANGATTLGSVGTNEIAGTATDTLSITTANGSLAVSGGKVIDAAGPVVIKADATQGSDKVILTLSEKVYGTGSTPGNIDATADFVITPGAGSAIVAAPTAPTDEQGGVSTITITLNGNAQAVDLASGTITKINANTSLVDAAGNAGVATTADFK